MTYDFRLVWDWWAEILKMFFAKFSIQAPNQLHYNVSGSYHLDIYHHLIDLFGATSFLQSGRALGYKLKKF